VIRWLVQKCQRIGPKLCNFTLNFDNDTFRGRITPSLASAELAAINQFANGRNSWSRTLMALGNRFIGPGRGDMRRMNHSFFAAAGPPPAGFPQMFYPIRCPRSPLTPPLISCVYEIGVSKPGNMCFPNEHWDFRCPCPRNPLRSRRSIVSLNQTMK
jgi:hypothetical protein